MTPPTPDNAARATPVAQRFRYNGTASWCYTDTVISETVTNRDGFSNENLYSQATVDDLLRELQLASGWNGDPAVTAQTAVENANALTDIDRATVTALEARIAELEDLLGAWYAEESRYGARLQAPGHHHQVPGIWDSDNGPIAGTPCAKCALWKQIRSLTGAGAK